MKRFTYPKATAKKQWGHTLRVSEEMYRRLDALRLTDKGKVAFEDVLKWLLEEKKQSLDTR